MLGGSENTQTIILLTYEFMISIRTFLALFEKYVEFIYSVEPACCIKTSFKIQL